MFQGTHFASLDAKGRIALPSRLRAALTEAGAASLVAARHPDGCLVLYAPSIWAERRAALSRLGYASRAFVRLVLGSAVELPLDAAGRIRIPPELRRPAGLEHDAAFVGLGEHLELWDRAAFAAAETAALEAGLDAGEFVF